MNVQLQCKTRIMVNRQTTCRLFLEWSKNNRLLRFGFYCYPKSALLVKMVIFIAAVTIMNLSAAELPAPLPSYEVNVQIDCPTPEAARQAELKFLPLPPGKTVAFSCRWDDTNWRHPKMKRLMTRHGYKGTFYLTGVDQKYKQRVLGELCKDGCTIGNHTISHTYLPLLTPNGIHYEMLAARIQHESLTDQTETAFIFPFTCFGWRFYPDAPDIVSSCLRRTGILGGPDDCMSALNKRPDLEMFSTEGRDVRPGDKNTKPERFDLHVRKSLPKKGKTAHLTLGVHVWHSDADFLKLEESLIKYANRADWWYCNENEYLAYCYMQRHTRITGKKTEGKKVLFTLALPCPEYLGSETPLWGECAGKTVEIRHTRKAPVKIGSANSKGTVDKFPGVAAKISFPSPNRIRLEVDNSGSSLKDVRLVLRLPPDFTEETIYCYAGDIPGKYIKEWSVTRNSSGVSAGKQLTALQADFTRDGVPGRIWVTQLRINKSTVPPVAQICCSSHVFSDQELNRLSLPETEPDSAIFLPVQNKVNYRESIYHVPGKIRNKNSLTVLMDFPGGRKMTLKGNLSESLYCNGKKIQQKHGIVHFDAPAGKCRILLQYGKSKVPDHLQLILIPQKKN